MTPATPSLLDPFKKAFSGLSGASQAFAPGQTTGQTTQMSSPAVPTTSYSPINSSQQNYTPTPAMNQSSGALNYTPAQPQVSQQSAQAPYTVKNGDTLSAIASQNGMSLKDLLELNPQYQANPNLIRPGEAITLSNNGGQNYTQDPLAGQNYTQEPLAGQNFTQDPSQAFTPVPQADQINYSQAPNYTPVPSAPTAPVAPVAPRTSSGETINTATGGTVAPSATPSVPATPASSTYGASATPSAPGTSGVSATPGYDSAISSFQSNLNLTPEEIANQEEINKLQESFSKAYTGEGNRPIPLEFITGRQQHLEQRKLDLAEPLADKAALLQAKRTAALEGSKFMVGVEEAKLAREDAAKAPISGTSFYDPTTKSFIQAPETAGADDFTLGKDQVRYDATGNIIASNAGLAGGGDSNIVSADASYWSSLINAGKAKLSDVPQDLRTDVAKAQTILGGLTKLGKDAIKQAGVVMSTIDEMTPMINGLTTGIAGAATSKIPGTPAFNLDKKIDTVKAVVGFSALQAMRAASPTGGALGQVSEMENRLLQSTLASLDIGQSSEQLTANLNKVKKHFTNLINVLNQAAQPETSGGAAEGGFSW